MTSKDIQRINELTAGPSLFGVDLVSFCLPCSALSTLKVLDQMFDMTTTEVMTPGEEFYVWRVLETGNMKLRFQFFYSAHEPGHNYVDVYGFKARKQMGRVHFGGSVEENCFIHFICGIVPLSKDHLTAVGMGQHDRLGAGSLLSTLPDGMLQHLMQPLLATLEHWDCDKEEALKAAIELEELELSKVFIDKLVASNEFDEVDLGIFIYGDFSCPPYNMDGMCAKLDQRFDMLTDEQNVQGEFSAKRTLSINGKKILFEFDHDKYSGPSYIRVQGLGQVEGAFEHDFNRLSYIYLLDALFRSGHAAVLTVTTDENDENDEN